MIGFLDPRLLMLLFFIYYYFLDALSLLSPYLSKLNLSKRLPRLHKRRPLGCFDLLKTKSTIGQVSQGMDNINRIKLAKNYNTLFILNNNLLPNSISSLQNPVSIKP